MTEYWDKIVKWCAVAGGYVGGLFGGWDIIMSVLAAAMVIDYVTGLIVAWMGKSPKSDTGKLDSKVGFVGIGKKLMMLLLILFVAQLDRIMPDGQAIFRSMAAMFYIGNEGISIAENLALAGVPFPAGVKAALEQLQKKADEENDDDDGNG